MSLTEAGKKPILDKSQSPVRWLVLFLGCIIMISNYYCYDNPAALKTQVWCHYAPGMSMVVTNLL